VHAFHARLLGLIGLLGLAAGGLAADYRAGPEDYRDYLPRLQAGDRLLLAAGDYTRGLPLHHLQGSAAAPIVVAGPPRGARARFVARPGVNTVSLVDVTHVEIRNLELDGRNLFVDAVKAEGHARFAHFVHLENLYIHDHAAHQQSVGISSKCPAFGWVIRANRIERVGTGLYLGDSDGSAPFVAGLIEGNQVRDTLGYNLQIKHQQPRPPDLPEAEARHDTVIRHNFFSKARSVPGPAPRPSVLVGHLPLSGPGREDRYLVHGNLFWHNPGESLFQGEGNLALYNNVFVTQGPDAIRIQPHNDVPRQVDILHNTVLATHNGISVRVRGDNAWRQTLRGNLVFAARPIAGSGQTDNQIGTHERAGRVLTLPYADLGQADLSPRPQAHLDQVGDMEGWAGLPGSDLDFAGQPRHTRLPGAYGQPGPAPLRVWLRQRGFPWDGP